MGHIAAMCSDAADQAPHSLPHWIARRSVPRITAAIRAGSGYANMVDLAGLAQETAHEIPSADALAAAWSDACIYKVHGDYRRRGGGISSYYSYDGDEEGFTAYVDRD